jgi:hypothetical protein
MAASAVALRLAGASYDDIAVALEYPSPTEAREAVHADLSARAAEADPEERDRLRALEGARLERLLRSVWRKATTEADPEHLPAVRVALSVVDRHTRLYGLDVPVELIVHTPTANEIDVWVTAVLATSGRPLELEEAQVIAGEVVDVRTG